ACHRDQRPARRPLAGGLPGGRAFRRERTGGDRARHDRDPAWNTPHAGGRLEPAAKTRTSRRTAMRYASITDRLQNLGSEKWAIHAEARRMKAGGQPVIELTIGEPDVPPDATLLAEATRAMHAGRYRYSSGRGETSVVDALVRKYQKRRPD